MYRGDEECAHFRAVAATATGLALLLVPSLVGQLLLGEGLTGVAIPVTRVTGIALIGLGTRLLASSSLMGMLTYSAFVTLYVSYVGLAASSTGILLWPAVALHAILTVFLGRLWLPGEPRRRP